MTDEQKSSATMIATVGCDRESAAKYVGCTIEEFDEAVLRDRDFARELHKAEAGCELAHMRNIQQAAKEDRHWRASVWWLERRVPERYARREVGSVSRKELVRFLSSIASGIASSVRNDEDRRRVLEKIEELTDPLLLEAAVVDSEQMDCDQARDE